MEIVIAVIGVFALVWWNVASERRKSKHLYDFFTPKGRSRPPLNLSRRDRQEWNSEADE